MVRTAIGISLTEEYVKHVMAGMINSGGSYLGAPCLIGERTESPYLTSEPRRPGDTPTLLCISFHVQSSKGHIGTGCVVKEIHMIND